MERDDLWALEATTDCVLLLDADLRIVYANRRVADLNGAVSESLVGRLHSEVWPQAVNPEVEGRYRQVRATNAPAVFEHHYLGDVGPETWHEIHAYPHQGGVAVFFRDLTGIVRREEAARVERERLESALVAADIGVWSRDFVSGAPLFWSARMREHFGATPDERVHKDSFDERVHPEDRDRVLAIYRQAIADRIPYDAVYRTVSREGRVRTIHARGGATYDPDGRPLRFDGFTLDATVRQETARQLREAKVRLEAVLASADISSWIVDVESDTVSADAKTFAMFGLTEERGDTVPGEVFRSHIPPEDQASMAESFAEAVAQGGPWISEYRVVRDDGVRWISARGVPELDVEGRPLRVPGVAVDVTVLKEAQERERAVAERLRAAERRQRFRVEFMDALRGLVDAKEIVGVACRMVGEFLSASRTTYGTVDFDARTVATTTPYTDGVHPLEGTYRFEDIGPEVLRDVETGRPFAITDTAADPRTRDRYEEGFQARESRSMLIVPLQRGGLPTAMFTVHDRNVREWTPEERELVENVARRMWDALERARAEDALRALNAELEDRVQKRTAELQRANEELQAFTSAVSHDLRGPLRNIHSLGRMLLEDAADRLTESDRRLLDRQSHNAMRLAAMVDALLGLARLGREPLNKAPFDLTALATSVRDDYLAREAGARCRIEIAPGLQAVGDRRLVRSVLQNLLENACKFSPAGGTIRVGQNAQGAFFVADEGVGFDMAYAAKLFQPFERLVSERQFPGTGIGLANVRRIVERHGGRVWAESEPGKGATFAFTLPD